MHVISIFKQEYSLFGNWTWVKTLQFLNLCIKKRNLSMLGVISQIPVLEKHRLLIL